MPKQLPRTKEACHKRLAIGRSAAANQRAGHSALPGTLSIWGKKLAPVCAAMHRNVLTSITSNPPFHLRFPCQRPSKQTSCLVKMSGATVNAPAPSPCRAQGSSHIALVRAGRVSIIGPAPVCTLPYLWNPCLPLLWVSLNAVAGG